MIHPLLGIIISIGAALLLALAWANDFFTKKLSSQAAEISSHAYRELDIMTKNVEVIAALRMKENLIANWHAVYDKNLKIAAELHYKSSIISNLTKFFRGMIYVFTIAFGAVLVIENKMSSGGIMACSILSAKALMPFDAAISLWNSVLSAKKSYERLTKLIKENHNKIVPISFAEPKGDVVVEKMGYVSAKNSKPIIKGVNINIEAGDIVAVIGPTAAGKSTLAKILVGINKPSVGAVRLDGSDISHWKDEELAQYIGYLPQDIELFNGDIKANIARMDKKAEDAKVIEVAQMASAHEMILKLPKGYDTDIGVWGANISGGQRQRIALARAFYGKPKFVVLDEPNSNLDQEGDMALINCLKAAKEKNITVVIISHRQQVLSVVDKILVMYEGEGKHFGPRDEVLQKLKGGGNA